ncbi:MAG TPA: hypothetical protein VKE51_01860 [Vicinamibacterales bacterium]|nr:hypothetical protein [Vicinamibacterales bacterium]
MIALGLALGVAVSTAVLRLLQAFLFGVGSADPATLTSAGVTMTAVALAACYLPARRAARVDPLVALKSD